MMISQEKKKQLLKQVNGSSDHLAIRMQINGLVQGVGFRPFVYRLALQNRIDGWVRNTSKGVEIQAIGHKNHLIRFTKGLFDDSPPASDISDIRFSQNKTNSVKGFCIRPSYGKEQDITGISPDIAVCPECLEDIACQPHRINYLLVNCTNCGPRFTIIRGLPYDRSKTTMASFAMCDECIREYRDIYDRRFHAQPIACNFCGPSYRLYNANGRLVTYTDLPQETAKLIDNGHIIAIKGMGGYHLACDALNEQAVKRLRSGKFRQGKPFAVMFGSLQTIMEFSHPTRSEVRSLTSWERPIVLIRLKKRIPDAVNAGLPVVGAILPYMPFHHLLFRHLKTKALVMTSCNRSGEPLIKDRSLVISKLNNSFTYLIDYNRDVQNRIDDSVVQWSGKSFQIIRRARGYTPKSVALSIDAEGILATGSELKNSFCLGKAKTAIMSQYIGDLKNLETFSFYCESIHQAKNLFKFKPDLVATDMHPDFMTSEWIGQQQCPVISVQHHHAHIASCLAEHQLGETVIGVAFDGAGYGTDGHTWGSEIMRCDLQGFSRLAHIEYMPMPGGDKAVEEPWRMALGCLFKIFGERIPDEIMKRFFRSIGRDKTGMVLQALVKNVFVTQTSGIGRLFDAVASLTGLCHYAAFEAEGPMRLEATLKRKTKDAYKDAYDVEIVQGKTILLEPILKGVMEDLRRDADIGCVSARFHNTLIEATAKTVAFHQTSQRPDKVVLTGGAFQNRYLFKGLKKKLRSMGYTVFSNCQVPPNDGGISLGQLAVAAAKRKQSCV